MFSPIKKGDILVLGVDVLDEDPDIISFNFCQNEKYHDKNTHIPLCISVRFQSRVIQRNTWTDQWGKDETVENLDPNTSPFPLKPGTAPKLTLFS